MISRYLKTLIKIPDNDTERSVGVRDEHGQAQEDVGSEVGGGDGVGRMAGIGGALRQQGEHCETLHSYWPLVPTHCWHCDWDLCQYIVRSAEAVCHREEVARQEFLWKCIKHAWCRCMIEIEFSLDMWTMLDRRCLKDKRSLLSPWPYWEHMCFMSLAQVRWQCRHRNRFEFLTSNNNKILRGFVIVPSFLSWLNFSA